MHKVLTGKSRLCMACASQVSTISDGQQQPRPRHACVSLDLVVLCRDFGRNRNITHRSQPNMWLVLLAKFDIFITLASLEPSSTNISKKSIILGPTSATRARSTCFISFCWVNSTTFARPCFLTAVIRSHGSHDVPWRSSIFTLLLIALFDSQPSTFCVVHQYVLHASGNCL